MTPLSAKLSLLPTIGLASLALCSAIHTGCAANTDEVLGEVGGAFSYYGYYGGYYGGGHGHGGGYGAGGGASSGGEEHGSSSGSPAEPPGTGDGRGCAVDPGTVSGGSWLLLLALAPLARRWRR
jgi:hypothetical protein